MVGRIPESIRSFQINLSDAGLERPILAAEAGRLFARWANVEFALGSMASVLIGDNSALAILDGIRSRNNQTNAIMAAAKERIQHRETRDLLKPLFKLIDRAAKPRNDFAHCLWGTIPELPNALLLCEPKAMLKASRLALNSSGTRSTAAPTPDSVSFEHSLNGNDEIASEIIRVLRDNTHVWRQADFALPENLLNRAIVALTQYTVAISSDPGSHAAMQARVQLTDHLRETEQLQ